MTGVFLVEGSSRLVVACENFGVKAGVTPRQVDLFRSSASVVEGKVDAGSARAFLHVEGHRLFPG